MRVRTGSFIWDGDDWVPRAKWHGRRDRKPAPQIIPDIEPYKSMVTGEMIGGRRQHRDHLRAHGCFEVGNEWTEPKRPEGPAKGDVARDVIRAMQERGYH